MLAIYRSVPRAWLCHISIKMDGDRSPCNACSRSKIDRYSKKSPLVKSRKSLVLLSPKNFVANGHRHVAPRTKTTAGLINRGSTNLFDLLPLGLFEPYCNSELK